MTFYLMDTIQYKKDYSKTFTQLAMKTPISQFLRNKWRMDVWGQVDEILLGNFQHLSQALESMLR